MYDILNFSDKIKEIDRAAIKRAAPYFERAENIAQANSARVMNAFWSEKAALSHLSGSTGYGYGDTGRDTLDRIYAKALECEDAVVRPQIISGTHALTIALFGLLRPGDTLLSITGSPYDTLYDVIGINESSGSLKEYGINYRELPLKDGGIDFDSIQSAIDSSVKVVFIQKSKGYGDRLTLTGEQIGKAAELVKKVRKDIIVLVDNCYGEFCEQHEPTYYGADVIVGSLIKNPGGGLARTGGYIAGKKELVEKCSYRLTTPGIGKESAATRYYLSEFYQGLFMAPHTVLQAVKTAIYAAQVYKDLGYRVNPEPEHFRNDIIQTIYLENANRLIKFCAGIQSGSPIDSFVTPEPWDMPGYDNKVIMAAGTFVEGASIELSADAPLKPPYIVYLQGGLTFESGRIGILKSVERLLEN